MTMSMRMSATVARGLYCHFSLIARCVHTQSERSPTNDKTQSVNVSLTFTTTMASRTTRSKARDKRRSDEARANDGRSDDGPRGAAAGRWKRRPKKATKIPSAAAAGTVPAEWREVFEKAAVTCTEVDHGRSRLSATAVDIHPSAFLKLLKQRNDSVLYLRQMASAFGVTVMAADPERPTAAELHIALRDARRLFPSMLSVLSHGLPDGEEKDDEKMKAIEAMAAKAGAEAASVEQWEWWLLTGAADWPTELAASLAALSETVVDEITKTKASKREELDRAMANAYRQRSGTPLDDVARAGMAETWRNNQHWWEAAHAVMAALRTGADKARASDEKSPLRNGKKTAVSANSRLPTADRYIPLAISKMPEGWAPSPLTLPGRDTRAWEEDTLAWVEERRDAGFGHTDGVLEALNACVRMEGIRGELEKRLEQATHDYLYLRSDLPWPTAHLAKAARAALLKQAGPNSTSLHDAAPGAMGPKEKKKDKEPHERKESKRESRDRVRPDDDGPADDGSLSDANEAASGADRDTRGTKRPRDDDTAPASSSSPTECPKCGKTSTGPFCSYGCGSKRQRLSTGTRRCGKAACEGQLTGDQSACGLCGWRDRGTDTRFREEDPDARRGREKERHHRERSDRRYHSGKAHSSPSSESSNGEEGKSESDPDAKHLSRAVKYLTLCSLTRCKPKWLQAEEAVTRQMTGGRSRDRVLIANAKGELSTAPVRVRGITTWTDLVSRWNVYEEAMAAQYPGQRLLPAMKKYWTQIEEMHNKSVPLDALMRCDITCRTAWSDPKEFPERVTRWGQVDQHAVIVAYSNMTRGAVGGDHGTEATRTSAWNRRPIKPRSPARPTTEAVTRKKRGNPKATGPPAGAPGRVTPAPTSRESNAAGGTTSSGGGHRTERPTGPRPCRFVKTKEGCRRGSACAFSHAA
jgi:hypothetical protein